MQEPQFAVFCARIKIKPPGKTGFGPCFHLPGSHFGYLFLNHSHLSKRSFPKFGSPNRHLGLSGAFLKMLRTGVFSTMDGLGD